MIPIRLIVSLLLFLFSTQAPIYKLWETSSFEPVAIKNHQILIRNNDNSLNLLDSKTLEFVWDKNLTLEETFGYIQYGHQFIITDNKVLTKLFGSDLSCIDAMSGEILWSIDLKSKSLSTPYVSNDIIYCSSHEWVNGQTISDLLTIDIDTGAIVRTINVCKDSQWCDFLKPIVFKDNYQLWVGSDLYCFKSDDEKIVWDTNKDDFCYFDRSIQNNPSIWKKTVVGCYFDCYKNNNNISFNDIRTGDTQKVIEEAFSINIFKDLLIYHTFNKGSAYLIGYNLNTQKEQWRIETRNIYYKGMSCIIGDLLIVEEEDNNNNNIVTFYNPNNGKWIGELRFSGKILKVICQDEKLLVQTQDKLVCYRIIY